MCETGIGPLLRPAKSLGHRRRRRASQNAVVLPPIILLPRFFARARFCTHRRCPPAPMAGRPALSPLTVLHVLAGGAKRLRGRPRPVLPYFAPIRPLIPRLPHTTTTNRRGPDAAHRARRDSGARVRDEEEAGGRASCAVGGEKNKACLLINKSLPVSRRPKTNAGRARSLTRCTRTTWRTRRPCACALATSASSCSRRRLAKQVR